MLRKRKRKCTTLGLIIDFLFASSNCTVGGSNPKPVMVPAELIFGALDGPWFHHCQNVDTKWFDAKCQSTSDDSPILWRGSEKRGWVKQKIALILKGLPPSHHFDWEKPQHYKWWCGVWGMWFVSQWNCWIPHRKYKKWNRKLSDKLFASPCLGWMFQP